jgi:tetratricopeptide (TPR) repeat protein
VEALNLGQALVVRGRFGEAIEHYQKALDLVTAQNNKALADDIRARMGLLQAGTRAGKTP